MTDRLRSQVTTAYTMLVFDFADPEGLDKKQIEECARCPIVELFDKQKTADRARRWLKTDFQKALALYFNHFQTRSGFDEQKLRLKLDAAEKVFLRHLGKDKVKYLRLLISLSEALNEQAPPQTQKPRGLLFERAV